MRPSVSRLIAYVSALGVPLAAVFETNLEKEPEGSADGTEPHRFAIRRSWEVAPIRLGGGVTFRRLSPVPIPGVEFFESIYPPDSSSNTHGQLLKHEGYEVGTGHRHPGRQRLDHVPLRPPAPDLQPLPNGHRRRHLAHRQPLIERPRRGCAGQDASAVTAASTAAPMSASAPRARRARPMAVTAITGLSG